MAVRESISDLATNLVGNFPSGNNHYHDSVGSRCDYALGYLAGEILADGSNSGDNTNIADGMFNRIAGDHRVLQENCMDIVFQVISRMADQRTDQRNAYTVYRCRQIRDLLSKDPNFAEVRAMY